MKLVIDGYEANVGNRVGIGRYAYELLCALHPITPNHEVTVVLPSEPRHDMPSETAWWRYTVAKPSSLWTFVGLPLATARLSPDVVFSPTHYIPRFVRVPRVMSIMDMSFLQYPELFRKKDLYKLTQWTKYSTAHAREILTISQFSKNAIIDAYGIDADSITVTYPGLTMNPHATRTKKIDGPYILSVGTLQPRKNFVKLIEAFASIKTAYPDMSLVIVGKKGWLYEEILEAPKHFGIENRVTFLDFVADEELPALYTNATCFVLPSLYEGFGLPVLEAMAYGTPVVVSNVSSLPEIAGEAGVYIDPTDIASIAKGLKVGIEARKTEAGKKRAAAAKVQVKKFTWPQAAADTLKVLERVGGAAV
jgi:glycosyltransferase involved in cell wall biosynthesis